MEESAPAVVTGPPPAPPCEGGEEDEDEELELVNSRTAWIWSVSLPSARVIMMETGFTRK